MATVKSLKAFLKCSTRFLFSRSFLRLQLESPRVFSPCAGLPSCNQRRKSTVTQVGDENSSSSNSPCFSHVVVIFISVRESLFYGIMQAGKKLRIVYIVIHIALTIPPFVPLQVTFGGEYRSNLKATLREQTISHCLNLHHSFDAFF